MLIAIEYLNEFGIDEIQKDGDLIQLCINSADKEIANKLIEKYNINLKY